MSDSLTAKIQHAFSSNAKYWIVAVKDIEQVLEIPPHIAGNDAPTRVMNFANSLGWSAERGVWMLEPGKCGEGWKFQPMSK